MRSPTSVAMPSLAGLPLSLKAGAGLSILRTKTDLLDVYGRYSFTRPQIPSSLPQGIKVWEKAWLLGAHYGHRFDEATLSATLDFGQHAYNYYGLEAVLPPAGAVCEAFLYGS